MDTFDHQNYSKEYYIKNKHKINNRHKLNYQKKKYEYYNRHKNWAKNNIQKCRDYSKKFRKLHKDEKNKFIYDYKISTKCTKCTENRPECLNFHHIDPKNKKNNISTMINSGYNLKSIKNEIDKCILLCGNCHRKEHYKGYKLNSIKNTYVFNIKLQSKCYFCDEKEPCCLDFHHIDPKDKIEGISAMLKQRKYKIVDIQLEIQKCIILCHNCHKLVHSNILKLPTNLY